MKTQLLKWFRRLKSISQYGSTYTKDTFDRERFEAVAVVANEIAARLTDAPVSEVEATLKLEAGPPTPKLDVRAAVFQGDAILLVRETADGLWSLPGGWADIDESPARGAERSERPKRSRAMTAERPS